ncbi:MAG: PEP-CTERM sorting domain-containing protein [Betaproteobacteria bacterium]
MRLTKVLRCALAVFSVLFVASRADATPIGDFILDQAFGPYFSVINLSADPTVNLPGDFADATVHITGTDTITQQAFATDVAFGQIAPGDELDTLFGPDLSSISLESAVLTLTFTPPGGTPPGTLQIGSFSASDFSDFLSNGTAISKSIDYVPTSVPEPATLLLLGCGLAAAGAGRRCVRSRRG